jgi:hypothetical protein
MMLFGGGFSLAIEHSKVCTLCDFGHLRFSIIFSIFYFQVLAKLDEIASGLGLLEQLLTQRNYNFLETGSTALNKQELLDRLKFEHLLRNPMVSDVQPVNPNNPIDEQEEILLEQEELEQEYEQDLYEDMQELPQRALDLMQKQNQLSRHRGRLNSHNFSPTHPFNRSPPSNPKPSHRKKSADQQQPTPETEVAGQPVYRNHRRLHPWNKENVAIIFE